MSLIYRITTGFPKSELYGLVDQLRRAAISISLNIAEGSDRKSDVDFKRFLRMAIGSVNEVVTGLYIAADLKYLKREDFNSLYLKANSLTAKLNALVKSMKS